MEVRYHPDVLRTDLKKLSLENKNRIKKSIENKLLINPTVYGEPLRGTLIPLWKLRVGDYRIVFGIEDNVIYIHAVAHRKDIYNKTTTTRIRL